MLRKAWCNLLVRAIRMPEQQFWSISQHDFIVQTMSDGAPVYHTHMEEAAMRLCIAYQVDPHHYWRHLQDAIDLLMFHAAETDVSYVEVARSLTCWDYSEYMPDLTDNKAKVVRKAMVHYTRFML